MCFLGFAAERLPTSRLARMCSADSHKVPNGRFDVAADGSRNIGRFGSGGALQAQCFLGFFHPKTTANAQVIHRYSYWFFFATY